MERGGGGFHGYCKLPKTSSDINAGVAEMNHNGNGAFHHHHHHHELMNHTNSSNHHNSSEDSNECTVREQDRFMPIANVIRIMRKILPPHAKISDDAKETIQECVSEYISFITGEANERCQREQRKTITAEDVLWAMSKLGFDDYIEPLTLYLHRYRELEGDRGSLRSDPLVKRAVDFGTGPVSVTPFGPLFHIGPPHHHPHHHPHPHPGYFGPGPITNGYLKDVAGPDAGSSHAHASSFESYAQHK